MKVHSLLLASALFASLAFAAPYKATIASGEVTVELTSEKDEIDFARDFDLIMSVTYPPEVKVELPDMTSLRGRFQGFAIADGFRRDPVKADDGRMNLEYRWRLVPEPAAEKYRLAPFAVTVRPVGDSAASNERSFPTFPALFPVKALEKNVAGDVEIDPKPYWIAPTPRMVIRWILTGVGIIAALALVIFLISRIGKAAKLRRMSPSERAFVELNALLGRKLAEKGMFKDFYIELTHVVRRYIERSYGIRAPEQTTEEFLAAAASHPRFTHEVIVRLADFLRSADMVKFAGVGSSSSIADEAVLTARNYIKSDTAAQKAAAESSNGSNAHQEVTK